MVMVVEAMARATPVVAMAVAMAVVAVEAMAAAMVRRWVDQLRR